MKKNRCVTFFLGIPVLLFPILASSEMAVEVLVAYDVPSYAKDPTLHEDVLDALQAALDNSELSHLSIVDATPVGGVPPVANCAGTENTTALTLVNCTRNSLDGNRDALNADVVVTIVDAIKGNTIGAADSVQPFVTHENHFAAYAVIEDSFFDEDDSLATHELGHLLYNEHLGDIAWGESRPDSRNHGYQTSTGSVRQTAMVQGSINRFNQYSRKTGKFSGTSITRGSLRSDVASFIDDPLSGSWDQVAMYRPLGQAESPPNEPSTAAQTLYCYGFYRVTWSDVPNADRYELWYSPYSNFSNACKAYSGIGTHKRINVAPFDWLKVKVRACNSGGCSDYGNELTLQWLPYCY